MGDGTKTKAQLIAELEALRKQRGAAEDRFRQLAEMLPEVVFEADPSLRLTYANQRGFELFGYTPQDLEQGLNGLDFVVPEQRDRARQNVARRLQGIDTGATEYVARRKDGTTFPVLLHMSGILKDGRIVGFRGVIVDITELKRAEHALRRERDQAQQYLDVAGVMFVVLEADGTVARVNRKAVEILGHPVDHIIGQNWFDRFVPAHARTEVEESFAYLMAGEITPVEFFENAVVTRTGEERLIAWHNTPLRDEAGRIIGTLSSGEDVTERVALEREKEQLQEQFRQSQKMEAVGRLAGGIAHDFNNLLTLIRGYAGMIALDLGEQDPMRADLQQILDAGQRAAMLVRQLLAFSRKQLMDPKTLDLNGIVAALEPLLQRLLGEDIELRLALTENLGLVSADPHQIEQVLMNLAVNARDAMPHGGTLTIRTANGPPDERERAGETDEAAAPCVLVSMTDTGDGMDEEVKRRVFEPFFTTKAQGQGTGLGLSTVYGIIKQSGGEITVDSELGRGTTFQIRLPRTDRA